MTHRVLTPRLIGLALLAGLAAASVPALHAQGLRPSPQRATAPAASPAPSGATQAADFIVAVVNSEPITNSEVRLEMQRVMQQLAQQRRPQPNAGELARQVLERLIGDKAQLQLARETGIRVDDMALDQAEATVARQNQMDVAEMRRQLALDGLSSSQFREQLRDQIMVSRLRERDVEARLRVTDAEVEQYLQEQQNTTDPSRLDINIAQILVAVPDDATPAQAATLQAKAESALARARNGEDFAALARDLSDAADRSNGGQLGLRSADRYPPLFVEATQNLAAGGLSGVIRSGAGFHILKLIEKRAAGLPSTTVTQSRARHILLRPGPQLNEAAARDKLAELKKRIESGQADFATLARENSQDGSAAQGGDLGWASPGQFVPEFESVMNTLAPGQISEPFTSRFGIHLIQVNERRTAALGAREQREAVRAVLREKKLDEAYLNWAQDVRGKAYVELREPPQ